MLATKLYGKNKHLKQNKMQLNMSQIQIYNTNANSATIFTYQC